MPKATEEEKSAIIAEYQAAVEAKRGGGAEVAKKHDTTPNLINGWMRARAKEKGTNGHRKRRRTPPAQDFVAGLDRLIGYHTAQVAKLQKIREDYEE